MLAPAEFDAEVLVRFHFFFGAGSLVWVVFEERGVTCDPMEVGFFGFERKMAESTNILDNLNGLMEFHSRKEESKWGVASILERVGRNSQWAGGDAW